MSDNPTVVIPQLCARHQHDLIVQQLKIDEAGPWAVTIVIANILLFSRAAADDRIAQRADRDTNNLSLVLAELGCLACHDADGYRRAILVLRKGNAHAAAVSKGEAQDPDWR